jgi:hypothetical protein
MTCVKSLYTGGSSIQNKDWATLGASAATIVGKGAIYASKQSTVLANALKTSGTKILPTPTAIVDAAAIALLLVDFLNGFGTPNAGSAVSTAAKDLDLFMKDLDPSCIPDSRDWSGTAATAYTAQVTTLKGYAQTMKGYDETLKGYLASQAAKVKEAHMCITVNVAVLTAAAGVALALYLIPLVGPEVSCAWQIIAAFACCAAVLVIEMLTLSNSMQLSNQVSTLAQQYVTLGKEVESKLAGSFGKIEGNVSTQTTSKLSSFRGISDGLTAFSFAPSLSDLANKAGNRVSPTQRAVLDASSGSQGAAAKSPSGAPAATPSAPATPVAATPATAAATPGAAASAAFTLPSLGQLMQILAQMSQPLNSLSQTVNQGASQIQQLAQSAKGPGGPAPAALPADQVDDVKEAAAAGGEGAERAPIDAAKSGAQPAGAGRERVL